jgi:hypothetical protein
VTGWLEYRQPWGWTVVTISDGNTTDATGTRWYSRWLVDERYQPFGTAPVETWLAHD